MKAFHRFSFFTTISTFVLIFIGGLVRVSGAGLGCPDWPTCFGRWIPPTSVSQLPPDIDPATFNFTLAWIEYINRLSGMTIGLLILATALWAIFKFRNNKRILFPAMLAAVLTAFQGWQGAVVVSSLLQPVIVTVHMLVALVIASLLVYVTAESHYQLNKENYINTGLPTNLGRWPLILWLVALVQILIGTQVRSQLEHIADQFPLLSTGEWLSKVGALNHIHMSLGILLVALTIMVYVKLKKYKEQLSSTINISMMTLNIVVIFQIFLGLSFIFFDMAAIRQVFHMFLGSIYLGVVFYIYANFKLIKN